MNAETSFAEVTTGALPASAPQADGLGAFRRIANGIEAVDGALETIASSGDRSAVRAVRKLQRQLRRIEPSVTFIGQVKAGKTSLVNALVGWPDLLPADVNPWTSVVTSLHLSPKPHLGGNRATFRFFDEDEWTRLLDRGGRIGELAGRAGAEDELARVTEQLARMREKSRRRLGDRFEMLMGQEHDYGYLDAELVERYVCLGDDFEDDTETSTAQGRFADITKSADLYLQRENLPLNLCIRDTPGVNDTFMMREQITIRAIRESRMCVVVLSAHQALSTVDLALIRLISNLDSREVIIFVNRIDELSDPKNQVPEIRESIRRTLKDHQGPSQVEIVFGSAYWANQALSGAEGGLAEDSRTALTNWAGEQNDADEDLWLHSGVPALLDAVGSRIEGGMARDAVSRTAKAGLNVLAGITASEQVARRRTAPEADGDADLADLPARLDAIESESLDAFDGAFAKVAQSFEARLDRAHASFLDRAVATLITSLERNGDSEVWQYDATGLRVLLRSAYQVFSRSAQTAATESYTAATSRIRDLYVDAFGLSPEEFRLETPTPPHIPAPVNLGQTIALDLSASWWSRWWRRRRGYGTFATDFARLIQAETDPIVASLRDDQAGSVIREARAQLCEFLTAQRETLVALAAGPRDEVKALGDGAERRATLDEARAVLRNVSVV